MGRKSKYEEYVKPHLDDITEWVNTMTEEQIADQLGIALSTFGEYKTKYPELVEALKRGRQQLVKQCRNNLRRRANGYEYEEKKIVEEFVELPKSVKEMLLEAGFDPSVVLNTEIKTVRVETMKKHERPDVAANNALLKCFDENWHEQTATDRQMKREELDIKKQRAEAETW